MNAGWGTRALALQIGLTAAIAQIVLVRELLVVFSGNEISLGMVLACWLAWTAAGSALASRVRNARRLIVYAESALAVALVACILAVREVRPALHALPGEILGPLTMLLVTLAVSAPVCAASGALFAAGSRLASGGTMYLLDALGSAVGGALATLILVVRMPSLGISWALAALALGVATLAAESKTGRCIAAAFLLAWCAAGFAAPRIDAASATHAWAGFDLIETRNSPYGNLAVVSTGGMPAIYENGLPIATASDPESAEEAVHYALLEHPSPRRILMIGGGINGSLAQALQHPTLKRLDYVELDPAVLSLARRHFPEAWRAASDARVHVAIADARTFLASSASPYDVILVNLPDPRTAQLNRFYTLEFFREAASSLSPTGVLALQLTASENYISPQTAAFLRSIWKTLGIAFPETAFIPGGTAHLFGARRPGVLASGVAELLERLRARQLHTLYVSKNFLPFRMMPDRMAEFASELRPLPATPVNRDFAPIAYYFHIALWSGQFRQGYAQAFHALAGIEFPAVAGGVLLLLLALALGTRTRHAAAGFATASMGFTMIGLEILLFLGFQALYGSLYQHVALLGAAFMAGMALGSWFGSRRRTGNLTAPQITAAALPVLLVAVLETMPFYGFPCLAALCGALGGFQFQSASRLWALAKSSQAGTLYALDLAGSCAGALLFSAWWIPVFGFARAAWLMALVSLASAVPLLWNRSRANPRPE